MKEAQGTVFCVPRKTQRRHGGRFSVFPAKHRELLPCASGKEIIVKSLNLNLGVEDYLLAGKVAVSFNPTDMNFLERLSRAFSELDTLQEKVRRSREKITDDREVFPIARELDGKMRGILNDLFGKEICEPLFGSMNLFASSGGLPVWANLMLAVTDEVQSALQGELAAREQRIAKYVEKYQK